MSEIRIGISGWNYPKWRGNFYPDGLTQKLELAFASRRFNALEINGTFYSLQRPASFQQWYEQTPADFLFTMKGGRYVTHMKKIKEPEEPLANYFASGMLALREKLGPILWQFPPNMPFLEDRFKAFFDLLPRDTRELSRFGKKHSSQRKEVFLEVDQNRPVRHAVEFRHDSFLCDRFIDLLRKYHIALVIADTASRYPTTEDITADWTYIRLHGSRQLYASGYSETELQAWSKRVQSWHTGRQPRDARLVSKQPPQKIQSRDVYLFFDNTDVKLRAPVDARRISEILKVATAQSPDDLLAELVKTGKPSSESNRGKKPARPVRKSRKLD